MYNYIIFANYDNNILYKGTSPYQVLDLHDNRQFDRVFPKSQGNLFLTEDIHYTFFKQLTEQISLKILQMIKVDFPKWSTFYCTDRYLLDLDSKFYIILYLNWDKYAGEYICIKCNKSLSSFNLAEESKLVFELCDKEESHYCFIQRFGHDTSGYWLEKFLDFLNTKGRKQQRHSSISEYPDIILKCKSRRKLNEEQKDKVYNTVKSFIVEWNSHDEIDPIHYFDILESSSVREIPIYIDFGNCEPEALEKLYNILSELDFINKIEFD